MKNVAKILYISLFSSFLCACSGFFDKDNTPPPTPLVHFIPEAKIQTQWVVKTGSGVGLDYLKLAPAVTDTTIFTADKNGKVIATNKVTGKTLWQVNVGSPISAGPGAANDIVVVGTHEGDVIALNQSNGTLAWKAHTDSEILAKPAVHQHIVLIKAIDGTLSAFEATDGHTLWHYHQTEPALILRGSSAPLISHNSVVAGFANGNLTKLISEGGNLQWQSTIARPIGSFAIQRMIDIDADPIILNDQVFAATYQGRIAALDFQTGREKWIHDLSSYTGMAANNQQVYVSDAKSHLWAFNKENGTVNWRQIQLESRNITGPVVMGPYIVVGDGEGYLHWISQSDGHIVARIRVNHSAILAVPVVDHSVLYVVTTDGHLAAYTLA